MALLDTMRSTASSFWQPGRPGPGRQLRSRLTRRRLKEEPEQGWIPLLADRRSGGRRRPWP